MFLLNLKIVKIIFQVPKVRIFDKNVDFISKNTNLYGKNTKLNLFRKKIKFFLLISILHHTKFAILCNILQNF